MGRSKRIGSNKTNSFSGKFEGNRSREASVSRCQGAYLYVCSFDFIVALNGNSHDESVAHSQEI